MTYTCPVCGYDKLEEEPVHSFEICPSCGTEFGYDDCTVSHEELRHRWIGGGYKWWSGRREAPENWNGKLQLDRYEWDLSMEWSLKEHAAIWEALAKL